MTTTSLRDEMVAALNRNAPFADLLAIVYRHKAAGLSQCAAYDTLQDVWTELGCGRREDTENPACESLEGLMDRVWGFCPRYDAIWDSSLSDASAEG